MGCNDAQRCDVQPELARLCEFAQAGAEGEEIVAFDRGSKIRKRFAHIVAAGALDTEDVAVGSRTCSDEVLDAAATVRRKLLEERLGLGLDGD